jgi:hypothetical protein
MGYDLSGGIDFELENLLVHKTVHVNVQHNHDGKFANVGDKNVGRLDVAKETSVLERYTGVLAEREGFEPSIQVLARITV